MTVSDNLLMVFVKNVIEGQVKTRLAKTIGSKAALCIYEMLLKHTLNIASTVTSDKVVFYSDFIPGDEWANKSFKLRIQQGNDLGDRMSNAFIYGFNNNYSNVVIIGSDCYELTTEIITDAFTKLADYDVVIGPAEDGGYYLLGMKKLCRDLFENIEWSSHTVFAKTIAKIEKNNLSCYYLPLLSDIDEEQDLHDELVTYLKQLV